MLRKIIAFPFGILVAFITVLWVFISYFYVYIRGEKHVKRMDALMDVMNKHMDFVLEQDRLSKYK